MKKPRTVFWGLYPLCLILGLGVLLAAGWHASSALQALYREQKRDSLEQQALLLEEAVAAALSAPDSEAVDRLCKAVGRRAATRVTVVLPGGKVAGDSAEDPGRMDYHNKRPEILEAMAGRVGTSIRHSRTAKREMMYVAVPLKDGDRVRAVVRASAPLERMAEILKAARARFLLIAVLFALLAAAACRWAARRLAEPLEAIRRGAEAYAGSSSAPRLAVSGPAEAAAAGEAVTRMAARLGSRIDQLAGQRNEYEAVLSSMVEGVIAIDLEERVLSINQAAVDILRVDPGRLKGRSIVEAVRNSSFQRFVARALQSGESLAGDVAIRLEEERIINVLCVALRDYHDMRIGSLVVLNDVTQVRRLEKVRQDFVANASHEIKTPLTAIKGFVETLSSGAVRRPEEADRFLGIISNHVNRLEAILEDLMALARLEQSSGRSGLVLEERPIGPIVKTAVQLVQGRADEKRIEIEVAGEGDVSARVDATLIEQALVNLVDNAVKYSPEGSKVLVRAGASEEAVFISIRDQGPGIARKHQDRLFERFYRVDQARSRKLGGTGLGLAIVKHILEAHGGHVTLESAPGTGSTFTLHLPRGTDAARA